MTEHDTKLAVTHDEAMKTVDCFHCLGLGLITIPGTRLVEWCAECGGSGQLEVPPPPDGMKETEPPMTEHDAKPAVNDGEAMTYEYPAAVVNARAAERATLRAELDAAHARIATLEDVTRDLIASIARECVKPTTTDIERAAMREVVARARALLDGEEAAL